MKTPNQTRGWWPALRRVLGLRQRPPMMSRRKIEHAYKELHAAAIGQARLVEGDPLFADCDPAVRDQTRRGAEHIGVMAFALAAVLGAEKHHAEALEQMVRMAELFNRVNNCANN